MSSIRAVTPFEFAFQSMFAFIATIINLIILIKEYRKRTNSQNINYLSNWTKRTSFICVIFGFLYSLMSTIAPIKIFCSIGKPLQIPFISAQGVFTGFNQLARLHYCFSQSSVHSAKGYPDRLFIIMIIIGVIFMIPIQIYPWLWIDELCGSNLTQTTNNKYSWISPYVRDAPNVGLWININMVIYILWDFTTLSLYVLKVYSFRRYKQQNKEVYNRIMFILKKVVILTLLYEIPAIWSMISGTVLDIVARQHKDESNMVILCSILYQISWQFTSVTINLSVFLMQSHNEKEYDKFLKLFYKLRLYHVCYGCRDTFVAAGENSRCEEISTTDRTVERRETKTIFDTRDVLLPQLVNIELDDDDSE